MARSFYEPRNRFVLNSKMDEGVFVAWLSLYLRGFSVSAAIKKYNAVAGRDDAAPSAKTVTNLFRRMGRYMFHTSFEPFLWEFTKNAPQKYLDQGHSAYQKWLDDVAKNIIETAKKTISLEQFHVLSASDSISRLDERIALEVRALLVARKGVSDVRADVGLAYMRAFTPGSLPRNRHNEQHITDMLVFITDRMQSFPMDDEGNTHHYLNYNPELVNYNQHGIFAKKHWSTHGIRIADWKRKKIQQIEKPKLGYIRTYEGENNYQEQRDLLEAAGCSKIFEDLDANHDKDNALPDCNVWPGLNAALIEMSEFTTFILPSWDVLGPTNNGWARIMKRIYYSQTRFHIIDDGGDPSKSKPG